MNRLRLVAPLVAVVGLMLAAPVARGAVLSVQQAAVSVTDIGAPSVFGFVFGTPLVGITGPVQVTTSVVGVFADAARNGASVTPYDGALATGALLDAGNVSHEVAAAGGAGSFAGAGGTAGAVILKGAAVVDVGAPSVFGFAFAEPISISGNPESRSHFGAALMDASDNGASLTGFTAGGKLSAFGVDGTTHTELVPNVAAVGLAGTALDSGAAIIVCDAAPCQLAQVSFMFGLTGGDDAAALVGRQEIGGDPLQGTVMQLYPLTSQTGLFDCGIAGCPFMTLELFFSGSGGGDVYGFVVRNEISTPDNAVPEPEMLALLALGLTALGVSRRKR